MGILSGIGAFALVIAALQSAPATNETLAEPRNRAAPDYPASCRPAPGTEAEPQRVTVNFSITRDGKTENVRVVETTNPCFDETAIAAARNWTYEPRRVGSVSRPQEDIEVTITFVWEGETQTVDYDARPILRVPPKYPERCMPHATKLETVLLEFDVTTEGTTKNVRAVESSNRCFERSAITAVAEWHYNPKTVSGVPVERKSVQTQITFELSGYTENFRRKVRTQLRSVQRSLRREDGAREALEKLAAIEAEFGDTFSREELASFHQLRAAARIDTGDYRGALDDLRVVQRTGMSGESAEAIAKTIVKLEAAVAAQEATNAAASESSEEQ